MIISILEQKYKIGCKKYLTKIERPGILKELNNIIDWKNIESDKTELQPGDCFMLDHQILAVDSEDVIVVLITQTGYNSNKRLLQDVILPEIEMKTKEVSDLIILELKETELDPDRFDKEIPIEFVWYKVLKNKYKNQKFKEPLNIEITFTDTLTNGEFTFVLRDWKIYCESTDFSDKEELEYALILSKKLLSFLYQNYGTIIKD